VSSAGERRRRRQWRRDVDHLRSRDRAAHGALKVLGILPGPIEGARARLREIQAEIGCRSNGSNGSNGSVEGAARELEAARQPEAVLGHDRAELVG
jgi:hypothetical protein